MIDEEMIVFLFCCRCMCNGHSEFCDQEGGLNCECSNNTETDCGTEDNGKRSCHEVQVILLYTYSL